MTEKCRDDNREEKTFPRRVSDGADGIPRDTEHPTGGSSVPSPVPSISLPGEGLFARLSWGRNSLTTHTLCQTYQSQQPTLGNSSWLMKRHLLPGVKTERGFWLWILADICWTRFMQPDGMWQPRMAKRLPYKLTEVPRHRVRLHGSGPPLGEQGAGKLTK